MVIEDVLLTLKPQSSKPSCLVRKQSSLQCDKKPSCKKGGLRTKRSIMTLSSMSFKVQLYLDMFHMIQPSLYIGGAGNKPCLILKPTMFIEIQRLFFDRFCQHRSLRFVDQDVSYMFMILFFPKFKINIQFKVVPT